MAETTEIEDVPEFTPENLNGHCFHKVSRHPASGELALTTRTFWTCCFCGRTFVAYYTYPLLSRPGNHGKYMPMIYDYDHKEWSFEASKAAITAGMRCEDYQKLGNERF